MKLKPGDSIFDEMKISYYDLRHLDKPIQSIREHYRSKLKPGHTLWWIDDDVEQRSMSPEIKYFSDLNGKRKKELKVEAFVLFPEIFSRSRIKFEKVAAHWASTYGMVSSSLRDIF